MTASKGYTTNQDLGLNSYGIKGQSATIPPNQPMPSLKGGNRPRSLFDGMRGGYIDKPGLYRFELKVGSVGRLCVQLGGGGLRCFDGSEWAGEVIEHEFVYDGSPLYRPFVEVCGMMSKDWLCRFVLLQEI